MMLFVDLVCMLSVGASVLRISFVIAKMVGQGEIGGHSHNMPRAHGSYLGWLQKDVGRHWLKHFSPCISGIVGSLQSGGAFTGRLEVLIIES